LWSTAATTQTITISSAGTYYVTVTSANGCSTNDTIVVTPKAAPVVSLGADQNICTSDTVTLDAGNAGATYLWSTGATTQTIRVSLANTYSVAVTNVGGCTTNDAVVITNKAVPVSTFTTQVVDTTKGQQVKFTAVAAAGTSYAWNFGDPTSASNTSSLSTPTHLFSAPGNYTVTLTVTNVATGCKSVTQTAVSVTGLANDFAKAFKLVAAPNPFAGNTKINYELPSNANVTLEVFDMIGRKVSTIANSAYQESGVHTYDFSAGDNQNASGVYMVRLIVDGQVAILRVIDIANR
jgi:PKD repeat protein